MISFDDRISSFIIVIIAHQEREERRIKYIMIFYREHDSANKHLWKFETQLETSCFVGRRQGEAAEKALNFL